MAPIVAATASAVSGALPERLMVDETSVESLVAGTDVCGAVGDEESCLRVVPCDELKAHPPRPRACRSSWQADDHTPYAPPHSEADEILAGGRSVDVWAKLRLACPALNEACTRCALFEACPG